MAGDPLTSRVNPRLHLGCNGKSELEQAITWMTLEESDIFLHFVTPMNCHKRMQKLRKYKQKKKEKEKLKNKSA